MDDNKLFDEMEMIITALDTLYEVGEDCVLPDVSDEFVGIFKVSTGDIVSDPTYDTIRRVLKVHRPESYIFKNATASKIQAAQKVVHDPPLTSIEKASHEDLDKKEEMLFKWLSDRVEQATDEVRQRKVYTLTARVEHELYPMDTIGDDGHIGTLIKHQDRYFNGKLMTYPKDYFSMSYKWDGVALALYYENGVLQKAGLRPRDGINGEDVTANVKYITDIPQTLPEKITCRITGELVCKKSDFHGVQAWKTSLGEKPFANERAATVGGIRQFKEPEKTAFHRLSFTAYAIEGLDNPPYKTEIERAIWCNTVLKIPFVRTEYFNFYFMRSMEANVDKLDYEVDGIVISVNDLEAQEQCGKHGDAKTGNPKGKVAWKFSEETATPIIKEIEWNTGRTGSIKPVAIFDPVRLAGTDVRRATLHNFGFMKRNQIDIGTSIIVLKAGKIIPKVVGVHKGKCQGEPNYPTTCPSCSKPTTINHTPGKGKQEDMWEVVCNNSDCSAQQLNAFTHYLQKLGVLGLGDASVQALLASGVIKSRADYYKLDMESCAKAGFSERESLLILGGIWMIYDPAHLEDEDLKNQIRRARGAKMLIPAWKLFAALGIPTAGESAGKALIDHFGDFKNIQQASISALASVEGVGEKTAEIIYEYFQKHLVEINDILQYIELELPKQGKLSGQVFCLSGGFAEGKKHWQAQIEDLGGKCVGSVSKKCNYLIAGTDSGAKSEKAQKLGIEILSVEDLKKML